MDGRLLPVVTGVIGVERAKKCCLGATKPLTNDVSICYDDGGAATKTNILIFKLMSTLYAFKGGELCLRHPRGANS
jgi:hypothetical protein